MFISLLFILFFISEFFNNSECSPKRDGASTSKDYQSLLKESTNQRPSSSMDSQIFRRKYFPLYSDNIWTITDTDSDRANMLRRQKEYKENFNINELVEINNYHTITNEEEWIVARIVGKENENFTVQIEDGPLSGREFPKNLNEIRKIKNQYFLTNELAEIFIYNEWIEGVILDYENGKYLVGIETGQFTGQLFKITSNGLRKIEYNINEIVKILNLDNLTGELKWIKAKIVRKTNKNKYIVLVVEHCRVIGKEFTRSPDRIRKFKIEKFYINELVEFEKFNKEADKIFWYKAIIIKILNEEEYILNIGRNRTIKEPSYYIRKVQNY